MAIASALRPINAEIAAKELPAMYAHIDRGIEVKDMRQAVCYTTSDFVAVYLDGHKESADEQRNDYQGMFYHGSDFKSNTKILKIRIDGDKAIVTEASHMEYDLRNTVVNPVPNSPVHCVDRSISIDTWTRNFGQWQIHRSQNLWDRETIDGQVQ
ncbi:hypothetical protein CCAX7_46750 [Capsulimonas corticalis]|uniref:Uncharacterized protein n=1 Tax=Capsulimonas corticalis TaxID=2219043 RepID=A0A402CQQ3_9BACT|nr:nuclear transport factor 2 family protein [Capsulimonas corticalis]BDI32624.1 hypothetical protein CCAX7_46750 [Capsulimonas corticalis]